MITELEIEREKCKEWYQNIKIDGSDGDVRETRQTRQKRKPDVLDAKLPEKALKVPMVRDPKAAGPTVKYEVTNGELVADLTLLNDTRTGSKKRLTVKASDESENQVECFYEHKPVDMVNGKLKEATDRLWYNDRWYIRGTKITVEYPDKEKETGHIMMFTAAVIWIAHIRKGEMAPFSKFHLRISELASKKYTMRLAQGKIKAILCDLHTFVSFPPFPGLLFLSCPSARLTQLQLCLAAIIQAGSSRNKTRRRQKRPLGDAKCNFETRGKNGCQCLLDSPLTLRHDADTGVVGDGFTVRRCGCGCNRKRLHSRPTVGRDKLYRTVELKKCGDRHLLEAVLVPFEAKAPRS